MKNKNKKNDGNKFTFDHFLIFNFFMILSRKKYIYQTIKSINFLWYLGYWVLFIFDFDLIKINYYHRLLRFSLFFFYYCFQSKRKLIIWRFHFSDANRKKENNNKIISRFTVWCCVLRSLSSQTKKQCLVFYLLQEIPWKKKKQSLQFHWLRNNHKRINRNRFIKNFRYFACCFSFFLRSGNHYHLFIIRSFRFFDFWGVVSNYHKYLFQ